MTTAIYGSKQQAIFANRGATFTRTHDVHIPAKSLTDAELAAVLGLESLGVSPRVVDGVVRVPCFFRPYVAAILSA